MCIFQNLFDELEDHCFTLDKIFQLQLVAESGQLSEADVNEKILPLRSAQKHYTQARELEEKANTLQVINSQHLHFNVTIMPAYSAAMQNNTETPRKCKPGVERQAYHENLLAIMFILAVR